MRNVVFVHGWGFDAEVWNAILPHLHGIKSYVVDLGFTGNAVQVDLPESAVYVGHSLGVMWSLKHGRGIQALVSLAGFDCFRCAVPAKAIQAMQHNLQRNMQAQMRGFYTATGTGGVEKNFNPQKLAEGLAWLAEWDMQEALRRHAGECVALAAEDDVIFPIDASRRQWSGYRLEVAQTGGHALPITRPVWCAEWIQKAVDDYI